MVVFVDDVDLLPSSSEKKRFESSSHYTKEKLTPPTIHISLHFLYLCLQTAETREREKERDTQREREYQSRKRRAKRGRDLSEWVSRLSFIILNSVVIRKSARSF